MAKTSNPKKRANKYQEKVKVKGSFDQLMNALFPKPEKKEKKPEPAKKKKPKPKK